jgi:alkylhydroperoxidase family enzyme
MKPSPRIEPLPPQHSPELEETFGRFRRALGFIPNSMLILQRKPKIVKAMAQLTAAVWEPDGEVDRAFKRLIAHVASRTAGCQYCMAHTAGGALLFGVDPGKVADIWDFRVSPLYSEKERVALDFAVAAASVPNGVTEEMFAEMRKHWSETQRADRGRQAIPCLARLEHGQARTLMARRFSHRERPYGAQAQTLKGEKPWLP